MINVFVSDKIFQNLRRSRAFCMKRLSGACSHTSSNCKFVMEIFEFGIYHMNWDLQFSLIQVMRLEWDCTGLDWVTTESLHVLD